jgi:hypothetical protein
VALALAYLFALRVCGFTGGVVKGKSRVCGSSTRVFVCPAVCGFTGGDVKDKSRVCGSSTRVFVCPAGMWLYWRCCKR